MHCKALRRCAALGVLSSALAGCSHQQAVEQSDAQTEITAPTPIPVAIRGQATIVRLAFPTGNQQITPGNFQQGEICYLTAGDFRIDCATDGSSLNLGPNDSNDLLTDNPMYGLAPLHNEKDTAQAMKLYGILFLVTASIDRLPDALADYIQSPGQHLDEAVALAQLLLNSKTVDLQGYARGGNFVATVELTDDGRDKLLDAMDEMGQTTSDIQTVQFKAAKPGSSPQAIMQRIR